MSVDTTAEALKQSPGQLAISQATDAAEGSFRSALLRCAAPAATLMVTASSLMFLPFCVNSFWLLCLSPRCFTIHLG